MASIFIQNFGPITRLDLQIKDVCIFIGTTGSGKSTAAKLIAIFRDRKFILSPTILTFKELLSEYNIAFELNYESEFRYCEGKYFWSVTNSAVNTNFPFSQSIYTIYQLDSARTAISNPDLFYALNSYLSITIEELQKIEITLGDSENDLQVLVVIRELVDLKQRLPNKFIEDPEKFDLILKSLPQIQSVSLKLIKYIKSEFKPTHINYIAAERVLLSMIDDSKYQLEKSQIPSPKCFLNFAADYSQARIDMPTFQVPFHEILVKTENGQDRIVLKDGKNVNLSQASSGIQSTVPLLRVLQHRRADLYLNRLVVIEEPELNLYPTAQKNITETIIGEIVKQHDSLIITTHSPYVLTTIDNLILAHNTSIACPDKVDEISSIISRDKWLPFTSVSCYYFDENGASDILDNDRQRLNPSAIDDVSEEISNTYSQLLSIRYNTK